MTSSCARLQCARYYVWADISIDHLTSQTRSLPTFGPISVQASVDKLVELDFYQPQLHQALALVLTS